MWVCWPAAQRSYPDEAGTLFISAKKTYCTVKRLWYDTNGLIWVAYDQRQRATRQRKLISTWFQSVSLYRVVWTTSASLSSASLAPPSCRRRHCRRRQSWSSGLIWKWKVTFSSLTNCKTDSLAISNQAGCNLTEIIQMMRSREEDPDLLYVIKFLAAEELPGLPPGGGITSKWVTSTHSLCV